MAIVFSFLYSTIRSSTTQNQLLVIFVAGALKYAINWNVLPYIHNTHTAAVAKEREREKQQPERKTNGGGENEERERER